MSEISISLPINMFEGQSIDDVIIGVKDLAWVRAENQKLKDKVSQMVSDMAGFAEQADRIVNMDADLYQKAQYFRELASYTKQAVARAKLGEEGTK